MGNRGTWAILALFAAILVAMFLSGKGEIGGDKNKPSPSPSVSVSR